MSEVICELPDGYEPSENEEYMCKEHLENGLTKRSYNVYERKQRFSPPKNGLSNFSSVTDTALFASPTSTYAYCKNFILHSKRKASAKLSLRRCFFIKIPIPCP